MNTPASCTTRFAMSIIAVESAHLLAIAAGQRCFCKAKSLAVRYLGNTPNRGVFTRLSDYNIYIRSSTTFCEMIGSRRSRVVENLVAPLTV
jgi:hypothetical protein